MSKETAKELIAFIEKSPTSFHAVKTMGDMLDREGYIKLEEKDRWQLVPGGRYYTTRNGSALIAFSLRKGSLKVSGSLPATVILPALRSRKIRRSWWKTSM